jgi:hypothetical protein
MGLREIRWKDVDWMNPAEAGSCEKDNEHSCSIKGEDFLDWLSDC